MVSDHRGINITKSIPPKERFINNDNVYGCGTRKNGESDPVKMDEKVLPIIHMLYDRYNRYHNVIVTNERIRKVMGTTRKGRANKKVLEYLHKLEILEPYYDNEPIDTTKVWKVNIEKVEGYLEGAG